MSRRQYAGGANKVQLTGPILDSTLVLPVGALAGWPSGSDPFLIAIDRGTNFMEKCLAISAGSGTITIDPLGRGADGTSKLNHDTGAWVEVVLGAIDADEANAHVNSTTGVHGLAAGDRVVGRISTDTLFNKTIDGGDNTITGLDVSSMPAQATHNAEVDSHLALHDTQIADRYTKAETDNIATSINATHYTKTEADNALATEAGLRVTGDALAAPQATTYTKTEVDTRLDLKVDDSQLLWQAFTPTVTGSTSGGAIGNAIVNGRYQHEGTRVEVMLDLTLGSTTTFGTGVLLLSLPVAAAALAPSHLGGGMIFDVSAGASGRFTVMCRLNTVNDLLMVVVTTMSLVSGSAATPMSWAVGDQISIHYSYEAAS